MNSNLDPSTLSTLRAGFGGDVLADGDAGYEDAGRELTRAHRAFMENAPDEVGGGVLYLAGPWRR